MLRAEIRPGMENDFEQAWLSVGRRVTDHPANLGQWLCRSETEAHVYYIFSDWTDEPSFREFERSDQHVEHRMTLHPYRSGGAMSTMTVRHALTGTEAATR
ncbi:antibiotic biosynthesis monooxygenase [Micromonospora rosaria]|uniref:Antibiotic biosynthesis monooxygenase n=2 Tax=Micromonospora rosaria TaxID=47874 RepID=A0A136PZK8_9ACTN|nr:antibiotic biosynthesis monooxygenase [Micromonospora rosaria]